MSATPTDLSRLRIDRESQPRPPRRGGAWLVWLGVAALILGATGIFAARGRGGVEVRVAIASVPSGAGGGATLSANGYVVARTKASITSKIAGRLEYLGVSEGSAVQAGEVLARLENADYQAAVEQQTASLALARAALLEAKAARDQLARDLKRSKELLQERLISDQEAERLQADLDAAEARVASQEAGVQAAAAGVQVARVNLENTYIRAPFDGTVLRKDAEVGELVAPSLSGGGLTRGAVVTMADLSTLEVEVDVNESYISRTRSGQPARITLDAYPDTTFRGEVRQVMPTADRQRATVQVKVSILDRDARILPEMGARVEFLELSSARTAAAPRRVMVPADAVHDEGGRAVVWIVSGGKVERREIEAGPVSGGAREVRRGLSGGESVVIEGPESLSAGARVVVKP